MATRGLELMDKIVLPPALGKIRQKDKPTGPFRGLVVCLEDVHGNPGVQRNISAIIDNLLTNYTFRHIYTEGAWAPIDSSVMRLFPDAKVKESALDYLINKAMMTGQERAYCMHPELDIAFVGVDDEKLFTEHKRIGAEIAKVKDRAVDLTRRLADSLFLDCKSVLARDFWDFMNLCREYDQGRLGLSAYLSQLYWYARINGIRINPALVRRMIQAGIPARVQDEPPIASGTNRVTARVDDTSEAEVRQDIASNLCLTEVDRRFLRLITSCEVISEAFQATLTAERARKFLGIALEDARRAFEGDLHFISARLNTSGVRPDSSLSRFPAESTFLWDSWQVPAGYYRAAKLRSHLMAQRTSGEMTAHSVDRAVLVVGGFHSFHCCRDLGKKYGMACMTVTPIVESTAAPDYWRRISGDLLTEKEIFEEAQKIQTDGGSTRHQLRRWIGS